jgi:formylmethanofuran dehydrogenase subunit E
MKIRDYSYEKFINCVKEFHGYAAPGVILGGVMVDLAYQNLPATGLFDAVCETRRCLPDAVQLLTPCTIGNGWLKINDSGRFALTMYDKQKGDGIRVFVDAGKVEAWEHIRDWFFKLKSKSETGEELILRQIGEAGASLYGVQKVKVNLDNAKKESRKFGLCPVCGEAYPVSHGKTCMVCQGKAAYFTPLK